MEMRSTVTRILLTFCFCILLLFGISNVASAEYHIVEECLAKHKAVRAANVKIDDIIFIECHSVRNDSSYEYEITFVAGNKEYFYKINAMTGEVEAANFRKSAILDENSIITPQQAQLVALKDAQISELDVQNLNIDFDLGTEKANYLITFVAGTDKYQYEINAVNGMIIQMGKEFI